MPTTFDNPDNELLELLSEVCQRYTPRLHTAGVIVGVVMASNESGDAVKHNGYPAFAKIKVLSPVDRLKKRYEAELTVDAIKYEDLRERQRQALLCHELFHIELKKWWEVDALDTKGKPTGEKELKWTYDERGRPFLKAVKGDWSAGDGFARVCAIFGADAIEYENITRAKSYADRARREGEQEGGK